VSRREPATQRRRSLLLQLFASYQRMAALVDRELARDGVEPSAYAVLSAIGAFGPLTTTELATMLGLPLTTASDVVRRLETRRHVDRKPHPGDGRAQLIELTPEGDGIWHAGWPALQRVTESLLGRLEDEDAVRDALEQVDAALAAALEEK